MEPKEIQILLVSDLHWYTWTVIELNLKSICDQLDWKYSDELKDTIQITINLSILKYMFTMKNTRELLEISMDNMMLEYPDFFTKLKNDENGT